MPQTTPEPYAPQGSAEPKEETNKYPHLNTAQLDKASTADVANYVYENIDPKSSSDQAALQEFNSWLSEKSGSFQAEVESYLQLMGWED